MGRIRHESVGEQSPKTSDRENRFPSPKVGSDQFLRIVSWQEPAESEQRTSPTPSSDIAGTVRSWCRNLSRRTLFIALIVLLAVLFIAAIVITLVVVFAIQGKHDDHSFTAIVFTMSTSSPPTPTPFPYPVGFVVGTLSHYVPLGAVASLVPDTRAFTFQQELLAYGNSTLSLLRNGTVDQSALILDGSNCTACTILAADDSCFTGRYPRCDQAQTIYCCSGCPRVGNFCRVKGIFYGFLDQLVESRVFSNKGGLLLTTSSQTSTNSCSVQTHRVSADGTTFSGSIQSCPSSSSDQTSNVKYKSLSTTTLNPDNAISADILAVVDINGAVQLTNLTSNFELAHVAMDIKDGVLSMASTVQDGRLLVVVLQLSRFYILRYNLRSGCAAVLDSYYQTFLFSGSVSDSCMSIFPTF
ncbi:unnamed protein product [Heligmosomoides polygyrus]|uniref:Peptidase A1 domain-containing protein n=1 Tax=Heligmosomoides polygyrus TaxID=6339 RepID=A0A183FU34_HELPZ|nr:unnamed protein product [Heligmosomoides polygyrus]